MKARLARVLIDAVRRLPRWTAEPVAIVVAALLALGLGTRSTMETIRRAFPDWSAARRWRVAMASYRQLGRTLVEFLHTPAYSDAEILDRIELENAAALTEALGEGRGVILVSGHYGNWEWLGRRVAAAGYRFAALYKEPKNADFGARLKEIREAAGLVQIDHDDMRGALGWLRDGGVLGIIMDQEPRKSRDGALAPLFGQPTMTHVGPFKLARLARVPVMTVFCRRLSLGRHRGRLEPLPLSERSDLDEAVAEDATAFNARLEAAIRERPDHWLWMYRRWGRLVRRQRAARAA